MIHKGTQTIETSRLILRRFETGDARDVYNNWACDDDVNRYMTSTSLTDLSQAQKAVDSWASRYNDEFYHWNITFKNDLSVKSAGFVCVVSNDNDAQKAELGYCIGKKWWNKGYMTEAVQAVTDYLFDEIGYNRVEVQYDTDNPASGKVAQKCGMQYEGTLRRFMNNKGKLCDIAVYSTITDDRTGQSHKVFGEKIHANYKDRRGAYLIPISDGKIAVVKNARGFFFLGGGLEADEKGEDCIVRECIEEVGYTVTVNEKVCSAEAYMYHTKAGYFHPVQTYYTGKIGNRVECPVEKDHTMMWLNYGDLKGKMYLEMQNWALEYCWNKIHR